MAEPLPRRLYRSRDDRMISGVSGGLADYFDIDSTLVRVIWVLATIFTGGLAFLAYLLLWILVPREGYEGQPSDVVRSNVDEIAAEARRLAGDVREGFSSEHDDEASAPTEQAETQALARPRRSREPSAERRRQWAAILLITLGALLLASNLGLFWWFSWRYAWPIILIAIGLLMLVNRVRD